MPVRRRPHASPVTWYAALVAVLSLLVTGCSADTVNSLPPRGAAGPGPLPTPPPQSSPAYSWATSPFGAQLLSVPASRPPAAPAPPRGIPALGPLTRASLPPAARQALVVTGDAADSNRSTAVLYNRDDPAFGWRQVAGPWPAHNGLEGWTDRHMADDLKSPTGVFGLTDAGGRLADPGALLPYDEQPGFTVSGEGFFGEPLEGSFDYVVAINYNRTPGTTPLDRTRPMGEERGGGIWIHVDHGGPTQGCVSLPEDRMRELLRTLDPDRKPVIVMGDAATLGE